MERGKPPRHNKHHLNFYRSIWDSIPDLRVIRGDSRLIIPLELDAHQELHNNIPMVPPLTVHLASRAFKLFNETRHTDPIKNIHSYMKSIDEASEHKTVHELERSMADTTTWALEMQIPWIQQGYVDLEKYRG